MNSERSRGAENVSEAPSSERPETVGAEHGIRMEDAMNGIRAEVAENPELAFDRVASEIGRLAFESPAIFEKMLIDTRGMFEATGLRSTDFGEKLGRSLDEASERVSEFKEGVERNEKLIVGIAMLVALVLIAIASPEAAVKLVSQRPEILQTILSSLTSDEATE